MAWSLKSFQQSKQLLLLSRDSLITEFAIIDDGRGEELKMFEKNRDFNNLQLTYHRSHNQTY
jgi:hypothetical protein